MSKKIDYEALTEREELFSEMVKNGTFSFEEKRRNSEGNFRHPLQEVLLVWLCGMICGFTTFEDIEWLGELKISFLKKFFPFKNGSPSKSTIARVIAIIDPSKMNDLLLATISNLQISKEPLGAELETIAVDGKTHCGMQTLEENKQTLHTVSAFDTVRGITLAQETVPEKTNEITAIKALLKNLNIENRIITIDAIGTQKEIVQIIKEKKGHYLLAVKNNQKTLYQAILAFFADQNNLKNIEKHEEYDKGHGRIEKRTCYATDSVRWFDGDGWIGLKSIVMMQSERTIKGQKTVCNRYFITDLPSHTKNLSKAIRSHWSIESMHWVLDMIFGEDDRILWNKTVAENETIARRLVMNVLKSFRDTFRRGKKTTLVSYGLIQKIMYADDDKLEVLLRGAFK